MIYAYLLQLNNFPCFTRRLFFSPVCQNSHAYTSCSTLPQRLQSLPPREQLHREKKKYYNSCETSIEQLHPDLFFPHILNLAEWCDAISAQSAITQRKKNLSAKGIEIHHAHRLISVYLLIHTGQQAVENSQFSCFKMFVLKSCTSVLKSSGVRNSFALRFTQSPFNVGAIHMFPMK